MNTAPRFILTDIEGTTTPIAFVRDVLFPYARARLPVLLASGRADVAEALGQVAARAPGVPPLEALLAWMDADAKVTPLKQLQGLIWREGYATGALRGQLYADVAPAVRRWAGQGIALSVYSSGSVEAQRTLFGTSESGDLTKLFQGFFDTTIGLKSDPASYRAITGGGAGWLFLSDSDVELDAAAQAGLATCQLVRAADGTIASARHDRAQDFDAVERFWGR